MKQMTDEEFDKVYAGYTDSDKLEFLGKYIKCVTLHNGASYIIDNRSDLEAVVEQELYEKLTGRE